MERAVLVSVGYFLSFLWWNIKQVKQNYFFGTKHSRIAVLILKYGA